MKILICDDEWECIEQLQNMIRGMSFRNSIEVLSFADVASTFHFLKTDKADVYLLDILMPKSNGIELGQYIRNMQKDAYIIYVTSSSEYTMEAFSVHAFQYLEKPVEENVLSAVLHEIDESYADKAAEYVSINTKDGLTSLDVEEVMYVENISRSPVYTLNDGNCIPGVCNRSAFENNVGVIASHPDFIHPHKSFFVNMQYIRSLEAKQLIMDNGEVIPISRNRFTDTKKRYMRFLSGRI